MRRRRKQLEKEGWLRQFVGDEAQAKDAVEIYDLLGYEVHLQSPNRRHSKESDASPSKEPGGECRTVYIRPKKS
jgi:hypothetical protein